MGAAPSRPNFPPQFPAQYKKHTNEFDTELRFNLIRPAPVAGSVGLGNREPILIGSLHCTGVNIYLNRRTFGVVSINSALE